MKSPVLVALAVAVLGACVDMDHGDSPIVGTSGDVTTEPGPYVGYRVQMPCEDRYVNIGVIGTGSIVLTDVNEISAAGEELAATMRDEIRSIWGWAGYGLVCEPGIGTNIYTNNWQDVDTLIARIGAFLRERDYALQVGLSVEGQPVPLAD